MLNFARASGLSFFVLAALGAGPAFAKGEVCITGDIGLEGVAPGTCYSPEALDALLDKPLAKGQNANGGEVTMTHPSDFKKTEKVHTCRAFEEKRKDDWYAMSGADMAAEGWFERTCGTLRILMRARGAADGHLDNPNKGLSDAKLISAQILPLPSEAKRADMAAIMKPGATLADFVKSGKVVVHNASAARLELTFNEQRAIYDEIARGDFNADGKGDVLLFMGVHHAGGSLAWYDHLALSRKRPKAILEVVFNADP